MCVYTYVCVCACELHGGLSPACLEGRQTLGAYGRPQAIVSLQGAIPAHPRHKRSALGCRRTSSGRCGCSQHRSQQKTMLDRGRMWGTAREGPNAPASSSAGGSMTSSSMYTLPLRSCGGARRDPLSSSDRGSGSSVSPCMTCSLRLPSLRRPLLANCRSPGARRPSLPMLRAGRMQGPRGGPCMLGCGNSIPKSVRGGKICIFKNR